MKDSKNIEPIFKPKNRLTPDNDTRYFLLERVEKTKRERRARRRRRR